MTGDTGPNFHRKSARGLRKAFDKFSENIVFIEIGASSGDINSTYVREGIVNFENRRGEDISVVYDDRFQAQIKVERGNIPDDIVTNQDAQNPDQVYIPRIDTYFEMNDETINQIFNTLGAVPLDNATVSVEPDGSF